MATGDSAVTMATGDSAVTMATVDSAVTMATGDSAVKFRFSFLLFLHRGVREVLSLES